MYMYSVPVLIFRRSHVQKKNDFFKFIIWKTFWLTFLCVKQPENYTANQNQLVNKLQNYTKWITCKFT